MGLIKKVRVADSVVEAMLNAIQTGRYVPGQKIPSERELTKEFGVSRTALREAFQKLEQLGKITIRQGDGTYLNHPSPEKLFDEIQTAFDLGSVGMNAFLEARESLETTAVRLAADRITPKELETFHALLQNQEACLGDPAKTVELDFKFHHSLLLAAKNNLLLQFWLSISSLTREEQSRACLLPGMPEQSLRQHKKLIEAIARKEVRKAQNIIRDHLGAVLADLLAKLSFQMKPGGPRPPQP